MQMTLAPDHPDYADAKKLIAKTDEQIREIDTKRTLELRRPFLALASELGTFYAVSLVIDREDDVLYVRKRLREMFQVPDKRENLEAHFGKDLRLMTPQLLREKIESGALDNETLYAFAQKNIECAQRETTELETAGELFKEEFKTRVNEAAAQGLLPPAVLSNLRRVDAVQFEYRDYLNNLGSSSLASAKDHGRIAVSSHVLRDRARFRAIVFHELLHEISGKTFEVIVHEFDEDLSVTHSVVKKVGVAIGLDRHNRWINEAITEKLTLLLSGYTSPKENDYGGSESYEKERRVLDELIERSNQSKGGLWEKALAAYFENVGGDQVPQEKAKHFKGLVGEVERLEGRLGWTRIENDFQLRRQAWILDLPLTRNKERAMKFTNEGVYEVVLSFGRNPKAKVSVPYYLIVESEDELQRYTSILHKHTTLEKRFSCGELKELV
jgi:hypothetical protein